MWYYIAANSRPVCDAYIAKIAAILKMSADRTFRIRSNSHENMPCLVNRSEFLFGKRTVSWSTIMFFEVQHGRRPYIWEIAQLLEPYFQSSQQNYILLSKFWKWRRKDYLKKKIGQLFLFFNASQQDKFCMSFHWIKTYNITDVSFKWLMCFQMNTEF